VLAIVKMLMTGLSAVACTPTGTLTTTRIEKRIETMAERTITGILSLVGSVQEFNEPPNSQNLGRGGIANRLSAARFTAIVLLFSTLLAGTANAQCFRDVPPDFWARSFIEIMADSGITAGCGGNKFCPDDLVTRDQMAVFLERGMNGSDFVPPPATGTVFDDVAASDFAANFIEQLFADQITVGCGNNNYCPQGVVNRAQMAVFLLRAKFGAGYNPPAATGVFDDVAPEDFASNFIEDLALQGISVGCGNGNFCPNDSVTRDQMAVFLTRAFALSLGPGDREPPFNVQVETPLPGTTYTSGGTVPVSATASDNTGISKVEFYRNGVLRATDTRAPWNWTTQITSASNGSYDLSALAFDSAGNCTSSDPVPVTVDITSSGGTAPSQGLWLISGDSLEEAGVTDFLITFDDNLTITEISYSFNGIPRFFSGSQLTRSNASVDPDNAVDVEIDWDDNSGQPDDDNGLVFGGTLNDSLDVANGVLSFAILDDSEPERKTGIGSGTLIRQGDGGGTPDSTAPTVSITSPASGTTITSAGTLTISASATDDDRVTKVEFYRNGALKLTDSSAPYNWTPNLSAANNGDHVLTARAYDAAGNVTTSNPVDLTVNIPSGGGTPPSSGTWLVTSSSLASKGITDFRFDVDTNQNVTAVRYSFDGSPRSFSGQQIVRSVLDTDQGNNVDIDIDWSEDGSFFDRNELEFEGFFNDDRDVADGVIIYSIRDGCCELVIGAFDSATFTRQ